MTKALGTRNQCNFKTGASERAEVVLSFSDCEGHEKLFYVTLQGHQ